MTKKSLGACQPRSKAEQDAELTVTAPFGTSLERYMYI